MHVQTSSKDDIKFALDITKANQIFDHLLNDK